MRRFAPALLAAAIAVLPAAGALAAPTVGGSLLLDYKYSLTDQNATLFEDYARLRVDVSGDAGDSVSYFGRLQAEADTDAGKQPVSFTLSTPLLYATLKNVGVDGLNVTLGRQSIWWSIVNNYSKAYGRGSNVPAVVVSYSADPASVTAFYSFDQNTEVGARVSYSAQVGGADVSLAGSVFKIEGSEPTGLGVTASVGLGSIGSAYVEAGQGIREAVDPNAQVKTYRVADEQYVVVGANVDVLKQATGISGWVEYDVKGQDLAFSFGRELVPGLTLYLGGEKPNDKELSASLTAEVSLSF